MITLTPLSDRPCDLCREQPVSYQLQHDGLYALVCADCGHRARDDWERQHRFFLEYASRPQDPR